MGRKAFDFQKEKLSLAFWKEIDYTIKVNSCRCDGMVDVVDSKSTASDGVPVRVRSPAPKAKERHPLGGVLCFFVPVSDSNPFQCQMPVAFGCHQFKNWWQPYDLPPKGANRPSSPVTGPNSTLSFRCTPPNYPSVISLRRAGIARPLAPPLGELASDQRA